MRLIQPNKTTEAAVAHPVSYAPVTALLCGIIAGLGFATRGPLPESAAASEPSSSF
jgi:hypothetical protein